MSLEWAAGFLEGEGSFTPAYVSKRDFYEPTITAAQVDRECLDRLREAFGGSVCCHRRKEPTRQPLHQWRLTGVRAVALMEQLEPLMSERRRSQIQRTLQTCMNHSLPA